MAQVHAAFSNVWKSVTGNPAVSFAGKRYTAVNFDANGNIVTAAAGGASIGVIYEENGVNEPAQVVAAGFAYAQLGGTVAPGAQVEVGADGKFITLATGVAVGVAAVGGAAGDIGTILLK